MKFGIIVFPGSNCDQDCFYAAAEVLGQEAGYIWHEETDLSGYDCIIIPGGFSYGDYLRAGAIARFSPVMEKVKEFSGRGGLVIGICNGFQVLLESGLLPGAMVNNNSLKFICRQVYLKVENNTLPFTSQYEKGGVIRVPIAHGQGNYYLAPGELRSLLRQGRVAFRYCTSMGDITLDSNPNGSVSNIAGIVNDKGNVLGMMPHPERSAERVLGSGDGLGVFKSILNWVERAEND